MDRSNEQRRHRNRGRQESDKREGSRDGGQHNNPPQNNSQQRNRPDNRGEHGRAEASRNEVVKVEKPKVDRSAFSHYSREEKFPTPPVAPKRDYAPDPVTGKAIDNIYTAMTHRESEQPVSFDTIIEQLRNAENLDERQQLIYVGSGQFGVYDEVEEGGKKRLVLNRKIVYEDSHHKPDWRRELAPGISRDYRPAPTPLDQLYSPEEESAFPKIGAASSAYLPRSS
jgi:hypothetical protein